MAILQMNNKGTVLSEMRIEKDKYGATYIYTWNLEKDKNKLRETESRLVVSRKWRGVWKK